MSLVTRFFVALSKQIVPAGSAGVLLVTAVSVGQLHVPDQYGTIQEAVNAAEDGDTILVGPGVYTGSVDLLGKSLTLLATHGPEETILDGENQNISVLVIVGDPNEDPPQVVIQGFTITRGRGTLIDQARRGGGVRMHHAEVTLTNCIFVANHDVTHGAAAYADASILTVHQCAFLDNRAFGGDGGGIYAKDSEISITLCSFHENRAYNGAGVAAFNSNGLIHNSVFRDGNPFGTGYAGGGIYSSASLLDITSCEFHDNGAWNGGAMHLVSGSNHAISDCHFEDNVTSSQGGAITIHSSSPTIENCQFISNRVVSALPSAWTTGGAILNTNGSPTITNCHFEGNEAQGGGAVMSDAGSANLNVSHCTFVNNTAYGGGAVYGRINLHDCTFQNNHAQVGGGAAVLFGPNLTVDNCTFHANSANDQGGAIHAHGAQLLWITNSTFSHNHAIFGGGVFTVAGTTVVLDSNFTDHAARFGAALFVDEDQGGNAQLQNVLFCRMQELAIHGPWTDFGGVNFCPKVTVHVPAQYSTIQQAIFAAQVGTEILVAPGVYNEAIDLLGKAITVRGSAGPEETVIDATGIPASVVACTNGEPPGTRISGLTITGGTGGPPAGPNSHGGGFYLAESAAPTIENCIITGNHIEVGAGGALATWDGRPFIKDCLISDNSDSWGSAISVVGRLDLADTIIEDNLASGTTFGTVYVFYGPLTVERCTIRNHPGRALEANQSDVLIIDSVFEKNQGTAVRLSQCFSTIERSSFIGNSTLPFFNQHGGALHITGGTASVTDCLFKHNASGGNGGAVAFGSTATWPTFTRCHFIDNYASQRGGGAWIGNTARFIECVFSGNRVEADGGAIFVNTGSDARVLATTFCNNQPDHLVGSWLDLGGNEFSDDCPILGDLNGDGVVDVSDLLILLAAWGPCPRSEACPADLNDDGAVDVSDLLLLLANWG